MRLAYTDVLPIHSSGKVPGIPVAVKSHGSVFPFCFFLCPLERQSVAQATYFHTDCVYLENAKCLNLISAIEHSDTNIKTEFEML
jgi:hypothetical protein